MHNSSKYLNSDAKIGKSSVPGYPRRTAKLLKPFYSETYRKGDITDYVLLQLTNCNIILENDQMRMKWVYNWLYTNQLNIFSLYNSRILRFIMFLFKYLSMFLEFLCPVIFYIILGIGYHYLSLTELMNIFKKFRILFYNFAILVTIFILKYLGFLYIKTFYTLYYIEEFILEYVFKYIKSIILYIHKIYGGELLLGLLHAERKYFHTQKYVLGHTDRLLPGFLGCVCGFETFHGLWCGSQPSADHVNFGSRVGSYPLVGRCLIGWSYIPCEGFMYTRRDTGCIGHNREKLLRNICLLMVLKLFFFLVIRGNDIQVYHSVLSHFGCVSPRIPKAFYRISLLCALCESYMRSFPNTLPQARKTILLLLLMCGDNAAATNPGPNSLLIQNPCTFYNNKFRYMTRIWDTWDINREDNKERDKELYREFRRKATINGNEREREIWMKEEEFIEQNLEWKEEKEGKKGKEYIHKEKE